MNAETSTRKATSSPRGSGGFTDEERAAMKERANEAKAAKSGKKGNGEAEVLAKIAEMQDTDREMAERIHAIVTTSAPHLSPRTWYGMPAYAMDGKVVCYFQSAEKFKARYATFGFDESAKIDDGTMWPTSFALTKLTKDNEKRITELVKKAVS